MGKQKLQIEYDFDFVLIAISFHDEDYKLSWLLNKSLEISLARADDLELPLKGSKQPGSFSLYSFEKEEDQLVFELIANRSESGFLIPEMKTTDYFLMVKGNINDSETDSIISALKATPKVQTAFRIEPASLKSKHNLLF
jgi:hypothetical protein